MILPGRGGLTGGSVIPSGNPLDVLRLDHHAGKRRVITSSLRERKPWRIKSGKKMLFSLGRWIVYERETRTRKPKPDALSQWRTMEVQRDSVTWIEIFKSKRDGALPVESCRTAGVLGPVPQKGPPQATGGHPAPMRGVRLWRRRVNATGQKRPDHSKTTTFCSGMRRESSTKRFRSQNDFVKKMLMWPASKRHT